MLKNQKSAQHILNSMLSAKQITVELKTAMEVGDMSSVEVTAKELNELLRLLLYAGRELSSEDNTLHLDDHCECMLDSLERLLVVSVDNTQKALEKVEFELYPLIESTYLHFYFWGCVYPDLDRMDSYYHNEKMVLASNSYINEAQKQLNYKYELSIIVLAYNKLDYTKRCVESILSTVPDNLNYELILINHGSTDGTKEYFESVHPTKQVDLKINGTLGTVDYRIVEGEYILYFSNDIIVGENAIENMLLCMKSDLKIGFGVPTTPNVSNFQSIPSNYSTPEEMREFIVENNQYNPFRHEQRVRLCNPVSCFKSSLALCVIGIMGHFFTNGETKFPDDVLSMLVRRAGYKNVLIKDAYCYHAGSVTIKEDMQTINEYAACVRGRKDFLRAFGVDPWGTGCCYDPDLLCLFEFLSDEHVNILGINSGFGSNPLKIQELYREQRRKLSSSIYNITDQKNYIMDLCGVSDHVKYMDDIKDAFTCLNDGLPDCFHYIVIDTPIGSVSDYIKFIQSGLKRLAPRGILYAKMRNQKQGVKLQEVFPESWIKNEWIKIKMDALFRGAASC